MNNSPNTTPWGSSSVPSQPRIRASQKALLSVMTFGASFYTFLLAFGGGVKMVGDVFGEGIENSLSTLPAKVIVVGLAYAVGWVAAVIAERVFMNQFESSLIIPLMWGCLTALCFLYLLILLKPYDGDYSTTKYLAYLTMLVAALAGLVGLHLIFEDQDLRPFSFLLLLVCLFHLGWMVYQYVFIEIDGAYLWRDLLLFFTMGGSGSLMLAHIGLLTPLRKEIARYISMNKRVLDD